MFDTILLDEWVEGEDLADTIEDVLNRVVPEYTVSTQESYSLSNPLADMGVNLMNVDTYRVIRACDDGRTVPGFQSLYPSRDVTFTVPGDSTNRVMVAAEPYGRSDVELLETYLVDEICAALYE